MTCFHPGSLQPRWLFGSATCSFNQNSLCIVFVQRRPQNGKSPALYRHLRLRPEELVSEEIATFGGAEIEVRPGAVSWTGNLESGYRACLWSRFASRILLELAHFDAPDPDALYTHAGNILWDEHFHHHLDLCRAYHAGQCHHRP